MFRLSLKILLPVLSLVFFLLIALTVFFSTQRVLHQKTEEKTLADFTSSVNMMQGSIQRFLRLQSIDGVRQLVSAVSSELALEAIVVVDNQNRVIASNLFEQIDREWQLLPYRLDAGLIEQVVTSRSSVIRKVNDGHSLAAIASICNPGESRVLRPQRCGFLYYRVNLEYYLGQAQQILWDQVIITLLGLLLTTVMFGLAIHILVGKRLLRVRDTLLAYRQGDRLRRVGLRGSDEVAQIAQYVDIMMAYLQYEEELLRDSEQFKQIIINSANYSIISTDTTGTITSFNKVAERILGYREAEMVGKATPEVFHDKDEVIRRAGVLKKQFGMDIEPGFEVFVARTRIGLPDLNDWTYIAKDGRRTPVRLSVTALRNSEGEITGFLGVGQDISEQLEIENSLKLAKEVIEHAGEGIIITDDKARIIDVNPMYCQLMGYSREEVLGENPNLHSSGLHEKEFYDELWQAVTQRGLWRGEIWNRKKNGEVIPTMQQISAIRNDRGEVVNYIGIFSDISAQKQAAEELESLAYYDSLTGLPNRTLFRERLQHLINSARRKQERFALMYLDLDRFKNVNDSLGHDFGDQLLSQVAQRITQSLRESDTVARLGGDEFTLLLPEVRDTARLGQLAQSIIGRLQQPFELGRHQVYIGASIGITLYPDDGQDANTLNKNADIAMYQAKNNGRGNYRFYSAEMHAGNEEQRQMENAMRTALLLEQFELYYQPIMKIADDGLRLRSFEAFLYWHHPQQGLLTADAFLPLAEDIGFSFELAQWSIEQLCKQLELWQQQGWGNTAVALKLSAVQFFHRELIEALEKNLEQHAFDPAALKIEIDESVFRQNHETTIQRLQQLDQLGISLGLTRFGSGYLSLSYLRQLPVNGIKMDPELIRNLHQDSDETAVVNSMINLARRFKLEITAVGVENPQQLDYLLSLGCHAVQGDYINPVNQIEQAEQLLFAEPSQPTALEI